LLALTLALPTSALAQERVFVRIDAREIERRLLHSTVTMPATPGQAMDIYFVEWTPGNHNPSGPIQNVVNLFVRDGDGNALDWKRDATHTVRLTIDVPERVSRITVEFSYITNQPSVNSRSTDSYGYPGYGSINWNTVLFYPGDADKDALMIEPELLVPSGWAVKSPLRVLDGEDGRRRYGPVTLAYLVDSPVILGEHAASYLLDRGMGLVPHQIDCVAPTNAQTALSPDAVRTFEKMVRQTTAVFGGFPYGRFHFLVTLSDEMPGVGVEHTECTFISMDADTFVNAGTDTGDSMGVMPHEYIHAWNGKLRAPEGLLSHNYHTPGRTELLWVYEGLTSYYDDVISARCGLIDREEYEHLIAQRLARYAHQAGRAWRSVEDTAAAQRHLRAQSDSWADLRRRQDYYSEGALFWMEADAIIRAGTDGRRSLDDFCSAFFDVPTGKAGSPVTYTRADVVAALGAVYPGQDWDALIRDRIERPGSGITDDLPRRLGYSLVYVVEPSSLQSKDLQEESGADLTSSLGVRVSRDGDVRAVLRGSPADAAGVAHDARVMAVNGRLFTPERLRDAVRDSSESGGVDLIVGEYHGTVPGNPSHLHFLLVLYLRDDKQVVVTATTAQSTWSNTEESLRQIMAGVAVER